MRAPDVAEPGSIEEIAKANQGIGGGMKAAALAGDAHEWKIEPRGSSVVASRPGETIEAERKVNHLRQTVRPGCNT